MRPKDLVGKTLTISGMDSTLVPWKMDVYIQSIHGEARTIQETLYKTNLPGCGLVYGRQLLGEMP